MSTQAALDRLLDPVTRDLDLDAIRKLASFRIDPSVQEHLDSLADRNTEGELSEAERAEYEALVRAVDFLAILRAKARTTIAQRGGEC